MENLKGKRLLLLGGSTWKNAIAEFAKDNGVTLIAAGNNPHAKYFEIADETYLVNSTDADAMKKLIIEKKIDGVHMGSNEIVMNVACEYLHSLNLPCYCTKNQISILHDKKKIKELLISAELPTVPTINIDEDNIIKSSLKLKYPVVIKPVDGNGSQGVSVCKNADEFLLKYENAKKFSQEKKVIIEKLMQNSGVYLHYTFSEGKAFFVGLSEKYPLEYKSQGSWVLGAHIFESPYIDDFRKLFEYKLLNLFNKLNLSEGNIWFEVFRDGKNYYFNEAGYRYAGSLFMYPIDYFYGINQLHSDIYFSLTGKSCIHGHKSLIPENFKRKKHYAIYAIHLKAGTIAKILGMDEVNARENVVIAAESKSVGDTVENTGTFAQIFALVHFVFDTKEELVNTVNYIHEKIIVEDAAGNNLVNRMLDVKNETEGFFKEWSKK